MNKTTLSELAVYDGNLNLPNGLEFNKESLRADILVYSSTDKPFPYSKNLDILDNYVSDYFNLKDKKYLIRRNISGIILNRNEQTEYLLEADPMDLRNATDYVMLYGVKVKDGSCNVVFKYDDNRFKNKWYTREFKENSFLIFPSTVVYRITKNESSNPNYILKINYESK